MRNKYFTDKNINFLSKKILKMVLSRRIISFRKDIDISDSALLIIDAQKYFTLPSSHAYLESSPPVIKKIKILINLFGSRNLPIIYTRHIDEETKQNMLLKWWRGKIVESNPLSFIDERVYDGKSKIFIKRRYDAFYKTGLLFYLKRKKIKKVFISGFVANLCCETTARSAFVYDFEVWFGIDTTCAYCYEHHVSTIRNLSYGFAVPFIVEDLYK
ncbi:MAG: isochorismatase family protein [Elusimicrobiales bacterium]|nr:isochorismatase family protein [Elusimicrobiales bacterium]